MLHVKASLIGKLLACSCCMQSRFQIGERFGSGGAKASSRAAELEYIKVKAMLSTLGLSVRHCGVVFLCFRCICSRYAGR